MSSLGSSLPEVLTGLGADLAAVEALMVRATRSDEPRISALYARLGSFHGKMLRPSLLVLLARAVGAVRDEHHRLGAAIELIHTATLVHDDLIDGAETRRGVTTAHVAFDNSVAVLLGDYLYTRAFDLVASLGEPWVTSAITATTNVICEGELNQMLARRDAELSEDEYFRIIHAKTAILCETACRLGVLDGDAAARDGAAAYGRAIGLAFQIVDDCLDLTGDAEKVGKTLATDIERGRFTLPVIRHLAALGSNDRRAAVERFLSVSGPEQVATVRRELLAGSGVASALATARRHIDDGIAALAPLPAGPAKDHLIELARFVVARDH